MNQLTTKIATNATPGEVWLALVDFPGWASWILCYFVFSLAPAAAPD